MKQVTKQLLSVKEAEEMTGRKAATWRKDIHQKKVAHVRIGRLVKLPVEEVQRLISEGYRPRLGKISSNILDNQIG